VTRNDNDDDDDDDDNNNNNNNNNTERHSRVVSTVALNSGSPEFKSGLQAGCSGVFTWFCSVPPVKCRDCTAY
jgi:hypothetical protein